MNIYRIWGTWQLLKKSQILVRSSLVPCLPSRDTILEIAAKNYLKADIKVVWDKN